MQTTLKHVHKWMLTAMLLVVVAGCDSTAPEDDDGAGEQELITRVTLTLTPVGGGDAAIAVAEDTDGDGLLDEIETLNLQAGTTYNGTVEVFDTFNDMNITEEIEEEYDVHQFFYTAEGGIADRVSVEITDTEEDYGGSRNLPVGLDFDVGVTEGPAASGVLNIRLGHFGEDPSNKNGTAPGETDLSVDFPVEITTSS